MARKNKIALVLAVAALPFILLNVWLALFALGGFVIGAVVVFFARLKWKPTLLVPLAILILFGAALFYYQQEKTGFHAGIRMNYAYTGTIRFVRATSAWTIEDQVTFPDEKKIDQFFRGPRGQVASSVADMMAKAGWQREGVVGGTARYTRTRTQPAKNRRYPIHTTNTFDLPVFRAGHLVSSLQLSASSIQVVAPKYAVSKTYPPIKSRDDLLRDGLESLPLTISTMEDVPTVRVELLSPWLQNEVGFEISKITLGESLKWFVGVIAGVIGGAFEDEIKKRLLFWMGITAPAAAPAPGPAPLSPSPSPTPTPTPTPSPAPNDQQ